MSDIRRAFLVGAGEGRHLDELGRLAGTMGVEVVGILEQNRRDGSGYIGKGKREELSGLVSEGKADIVITDDELTASQARVLEGSVDAPVMDRTELIIRIFEAHARDSASRLEVELADLEYRLPRIKGGNSSFSRLGGGGFTTRGSGEQQLEYDRREIRDKISLINRRLKDETAAREVRSRRRKDSQSPPSVALVGYTNAGKTTILNALTGAGRSTKDRLFETLETTTRLVEGSTSDNGSESRPDFVITDTVGFIQKLPTQLVHSFASTLESARDADIIVICADASSDELESHISTVRDTLSGSLGENYILCLNKSDLLNKDDRDSVLRRNPGAVLITARQNVSLLLDEIYDRISSRRHRFTLLIPHDQYGAASALYDLAEIHSSSSTERGVLLDATLPSNLASRYEKYTVSQTGSLST